MQSFSKTFPARAAILAAVVGVAASLTSQVASAAPGPVAKTPRSAQAVADRGQAAARSVSPARVRSLLRFETVRWAGKPVKTLDERSRILLAQAAAAKAGLHEVGLSFQDVYGVIEAETSWIPRTGASKNGTPNLGLAQFEPRTAQGMGLKDPGDPVQAVFAAARYMKDGAQWAADKIAHLDLAPQQRAAKLREGVSIHYNLSVKGRNKWNGLNTAQLPVETRRHIRNASEGAKEAAELARRIPRA